MQHSCSARVQWPCLADFRMLIDAYPKGNDRGQQKGKREIAIYLKNGLFSPHLHHLYKICFLVCILFNCIMGESRTFPLTGQYLCKCIKNKRIRIRIRFNSHRTGLHCLHCLQVAITAPERGQITHPAEEGWPHHRGLLPLLLSIEQWCGLLYVPQEPSGSAVRRFTLLILGYTPEWMLFHCFGTPVSDERDVISSISDRTNRVKEQNCCWNYFYFSFKDLKNIKLFISGKSKQKITIINALAGNRTRASRVAGENSTTEPPVLLHSCSMNLKSHWMVKHQ